MNDQEIHPLPAALRAIEAETRLFGFGMASDRQTGAFLRTLAAAKPGGAFLELGTGTGMATAWLLDGMDAGSTLLTGDADPAVIAVARRHLGDDPRATFHVGDGAGFLETLVGRRFDFVFADTWPGKYDHLDEALALLAPSAFYVIDDMLPQPNWPEGHAAKAERLAVELAARRELTLVKLGWSTGLMVAVRRA